MESYHFCIAGVNSVIKATNNKDSKGTVGNQSFYAVIGHFMFGNPLTCGWHGII